MCDYGCDPERPFEEGSALANVPDVGTIIFAVISIITSIVSAVAAWEWILAIGFRLIAFVVPIFAGLMWWIKCEHHNLVGGDKSVACMAGIVDSMNTHITTNALGPAEPFLSWARDAAEDTSLFPFLDEHPSFTLVVKCKYWNELQAGSGYYWYNHNIYGEAVSPIAICFVRSQAVCDRLRDSFIWSMVFTTLGVGMGMVAEGAIAGMAVCAATVICGILAILAFLVISLAMAILGANIPKIAGNSGTPPIPIIVSDDDPTTPDMPATVRVGDLLAVRGNFTTVESQRKAKVFWFVEDIAHFGRIPDEDTPGILPLPAFTSDMANEALSYCPEGAGPEDPAIHLEAMFCEPGSSPEDPKALIISNLWTASGLEYEVANTGMGAGAVQYVDRSYTFSDVPSHLDTATYVRTANDDKDVTENPLMRFDVNMDVRVYVAHDDRINSKPAWLNAFLDSGDEIINDESSPVTFSLFFSDFNAGAVELGSNWDPPAGGNGMYSVVIVPA